MSWLSVCMSVFPLVGVLLVHLCASPQPSAWCRAAGRQSLCAEWMQQCTAVLRPAESLPPSSSSMAMHVPSHPEPWYPPTTHCVWWNCGGYRRWPLWEWQVLLLTGWYLFSQAKLLRQWSKDEVKVTEHLWTVVWGGEDRRAPQRAWSFNGVLRAASWSAHDYH